MEDEGGGTGSSAASRAAAAAAERKKGRGGKDDMDDDNRYAGRGGVFDTLDAEAGPGPQKSVEGWILFITGVHEEATDSDVLDTFNEYGRVINCTVELDRRTGYTKGYALVEYSSRKEAEKAIDEMDGKEVLGKTVRVDWAFMKGPADVRRGGKRDR